MDETRMMLRRWCYCQASRQSCRDPHCFEHHGVPKMETRREANRVPKTKVHPLPKLRMVR